MIPRIFDSVRWRPIKALIEWEISHELTNGWSYLFSLVGYAGLSVLFLGLGAVLSESYIRILLPGVVVAFAMRPFLKIGKPVVESSSIPRKFLSSPVPAILFAFRGVTSRLIKMILGLGAFIGLMVLMSFPLPFLSSWAFWGGLLFVLPGALGGGGLISVVQALADTDDSFRWWAEFLFELFGGVFFRPEVLPAGLVYFSYLVPHYYPIELARSGWTSTVGLVSIFVSITLFCVGLLSLIAVLKQKMIGGRFHRVT